MLRVFEFPVLISPIARISRLPQYDVNYGSFLWNFHRNEPQFTSHCGGREIRAIGEMSRVNARYEQFASSILLVFERFLCSSQQFHAFHARHDLMSIMVHFHGLSIEMNHDPHQTVEVWIARGLLRGAQKLSIRATCLQQYQLYSLLNSAICRISDVFEFDADRGSFTWKVRRNEP